MTDCDVCGLAAAGTGRRHSGCDQALKDGATIIEARELIRRKVRDSSREQMHKAAENAVSMAGICTILFMLAGAVIGFNATRDEFLSWVLAALGALLGGSIGGAAFSKVKLQVVAARRIDRYISGETDLL